MVKTKDYYKEIDIVLADYENYKTYPRKPLSWATDRIDWCWKWRKITKEQMEELAERVVSLYERGDI